VVAAAACLGLVLALSACGGGGGGSGPGSTQLKLVIGNALPLSGTSKALGESGQKAAGLAIEQIRSAIAETGSPHAVRAMQQDEGPDPASARAAAKRLVDQGGASCLTGPWSAEGVEQVAHDVAVPSKVLEIAPVPTSPTLAELSDHDLVDSTALPESEEGVALSKAIEDELGGAQGHTVNVAASNDSYGDTLRQDFVEEWQDKDGTVGQQTTLAPPAPPSNSSSSAESSQLTGGSPDAVLVIDDLSGFSQLAPGLPSSPGWNAEARAAVRPGV